MARRRRSISSATTGVPVTCSAPWPHAPTSSGRSPPTAAACSTPTTCGTTWPRPGRHRTPASRWSTGWSARRSPTATRCSRSSVRPSDIAAAMAEGADEDMGRCILTLYRDRRRSRRPRELGRAAGGGDTAAGPVGIVPSEDPYVSADLGGRRGRRSFGAESSRWTGAVTGGCSRSRAWRPTGSWRSGRDSI